MNKNNNKTTFQKKLLYFLIMSMGVIINICLFFLFKKYELFRYQKKDHGGIGDIFPIMYQITLYYVILVKLHNFSKHIFQKNNQEIINFYWGRASFSENLIFNHKLSNNPQIRNKQKKLIKQKTMLQRLLMINMILMFILIFVIELNSTKKHEINNDNKLLKLILFILFFLLYILLQGKLYNVCVNKQSLDVEDEVVKNSVKVSKKEMYHNLKMQEIQKKLLQKDKLLSVTMFIICPLMLFFGFLCLNNREIIIKCCAIGLVNCFFVLFIYCHISQFILIIKQEQLSSEADEK